MTNNLFNPKSLCVLVVDDHDSIRKGIRKILNHMDFGEIKECADGREALEFLQSKPIDLVILDLYMRNLNGFELLDAIRNQDVGSDVPVLVVTGEASKEEIVKVADKGAEDYLLKPFQSQDLEKKITKVLNKYYSPTPLVKLLRRAERQYLNEDFSTALELFNSALNLDPQSARGTNGKALTLAKQGKGDEAVNILAQSISNNDSYYKNFRALADIFLKQDKISDAINAMERELQINPKQPERQVQIAKLLLKAGKGLKAIEHYRVALQEEPNKLVALMGMGHSYAQTDNLLKALYYFKRVRRYHPTVTKALEAAVRYCLACNETKKAEHFLKDEKKRYPNREDTYLILATLLFKLERDDESLEIANELLVKSPGHPSALRLKANIYLKKTDYKNALVALEELSKSSPSTEILATMGEILIALSRIPEAFTALNNAITLNPTNAHAMVLLADAHKRTKQWLKASHLYMRAAQLGAAPEKCQSEFKECERNFKLHRQKPRLAS